MKRNNQYEAQFENVQNPSITREDVAEVLVSVLTDEALQVVTNSKSSMVICHYQTQRLNIWRNNK